MTDTTGKSNEMWGGRFTAKPDDVMEAINASIDVDKRLAEEDIAGSMAHATMLAACDIISQDDLSAIMAGLEQVLEEIRTEKFQYSRALEDIHMNVEARLKEIIGDPAGRLHTGRSHLTTGSSAPSPRALPSSLLIPACTPWISV